MKQKTIAILTVAIAAASILFVLLTKSADKHPNQPIVLPERNTVEFISVQTTDGNSYTYQDDEDIDRIYDILEDTKDTGEASVNDTPSVKPYGKIEIRGGNAAVIIYYYAKGGIFRLEQPYTGIYSTVEDLDMTFTQLN